MGLKSNSDSTRDFLSTRNMYSETKIYDLNKNDLSRTLNNLENIGLNPRGSIITNLAEAAFQYEDSKVIQVASQRLPIELAKRAVNNIENVAKSFIDTKAIFSKDPNSKIFKLPKDYIITPKDNTFDYLLKKSIGINNYRQPSKEQEPIVLIDYYKKLGKGQKEIFQNQIQNNFYSYYNLRIDQDKYKSPILKFLYNDDYIIKKINALNLGDKTPVFSFTYTKKDGNLGNDKKIEKVENTINIIEHKKDILINEEFGLINKNLKSDNDGEQVIFRYGVSDENTFHLKRGLLYYTNQIAKSTDSKYKELVKQDTIEWKVDEETTFKGTSKCRSFTIFKKYGEENTEGDGHLMRYDGNGAEDSVLKNSVFAKIHPIDEDFKADKKTYKDDTHFMFSIENLAIDATAEQLPYVQRGPKNGKIMWFPPYGLSFNEQVSVINEEEKILGRIEPLYSYNGTKRTATLDFIILIDYPGIADDISIDKLDEFFNGCDINFNKNQNNDKLAKEKPVSDSQIQQSPSKDKKTLDKFTYYFENDIDVFQSNYEISSASFDNDSPDKANLFGLNKDYLTKENKLFEFIKSNQGTNIEITLNGHASKLDTSDYNLKLSLRRAYYLAKRFASNCNLSLEDKFANFLQSNEYKKITAKNANKSFIFKSTNEKKISFILKGFGEENPNPSSKDLELKKEINNYDQKIKRYVEISGTYNLNDGQNVSNNPQQTSKEKINQNEEQKQKDGDKNVDRLDNGRTPFKKSIGQTDKDKYYNIKGFQNQDYYKPVFHSQTPFNFWERYTFLHQCTRPGRTISKDIASNSIFGKTPSCILRIGDFFHTRIVINSINFKFGDTLTWDLNPEGMGVQPRLCNVSIEFAIVGGMSMKWAIDKLQTAVDQNFTANSTYKTNNELYSKYHNTILQNRTKAIQVEQLQQDINRPSNKTKPETTQTNL